MSAILLQPPAVVYQARRSETDSLDSTTRIALDINLSPQARLALESAFNDKVQHCRPSNATTDETSRRRDLILQDLLRSSISVDVVMHDFSLVTYYTSPCGEEEDGSTEDGGAMGTMAAVPAPSVEISAPSSVPGMIHLCVLPRTLPISSTHSGRPFRLIIRVRVGQGSPSVSASSSAHAGSSARGTGAGGSPRSNVAVDEVLVTTPFHVLAKEPSRQSTQGPRPRGQASKKRKRAAAAGATDALAGQLAMLPGGVMLSPRDLQLLDVTEAAVRMSLQAEMNGTSSESMQALLYGDLNRVSALRLLASGLLQPVPASAVSAQHVEACTGVEEQEARSEAATSAVQPAAWPLTGMRPAISLQPVSCGPTMASATTMQGSAHASGSSSDRASMAEQTDAPLRSMRSGAAKRTKSESSVSVPALRLPLGVSSGGASGSTSTAVPPIVPHPSSLGLRTISNSSTLTSRTDVSAAYTDHGRCTSDEEAADAERGLVSPVDSRPSPMQKGRGASISEAPKQAVTGAQLQGMMGHGMYWPPHGGTVPAPVPATQLQLQHHMQHLQLQQMQQHYAFLANSAAALGHLPMALNQQLHLSQIGAYPPLDGGATQHMQARLAHVQAFAGAQRAPGGGRSTGGDDEVTALATLGALASAAEYGMQQ